MPFDFSPLDETRDLIVALGKSLFPALNFGSRQGFYGKLATFMAGAVTQIAYAANTAQSDLHPLTAGDGKPINDWGTAFGVPRKGATPARKAKAGRVRGAAGRTAASGLQLRHAPTGLVYQLAGTATIPGVLGTDPDGFVDVDIVAVDTGSITRLSAGETLSFLLDPVGIESDVVLQLDLDEDGFDDEQYGSYRREVLATMAATPSGGSQSDFVRWIQESLPQIKIGYAYPNRNGTGTIDVLGFYAGSGTARILSAPDTAAMLAYLRTKAPFHVAGPGGGLRAITAVADPQRVEILITTTGVDAYDFDWTGSAAVLTYTAATRSLKFAAPLPATLRVGARLILVGVDGGGSGSMAQDGSQYQVESITAADTVTLDRAPPTPPAVGDLIYPGGPLVDPLRLAIRGHMNGEIVYAGRGNLPIPESLAAPITPSGQSIIGLDALADGLGPANPGGIYGSWAGGLLVGTLYKICTYKAGVRSITLVSPAASYEATDDAFPNNGQIHFITPGPIIIRSA